MDKYTIREWWVVVCVMLYHLSSGCIQALPGVVVLELTGNNTDGTGNGIHATREQASWFLAAYGVTGPIGFVILPALMQRCGRRMLNVVMNLLLVTGSVTMAVASDVTALTVGRAITGLSFSGLIICCVIVAEYTHPKRRGYFIVLKLLISNVGELICHIFCFRISWRLMAWYSTIPSILAALGTLKWVESPAWLAYKGRYEDCTKAFEYMRGKDKVSKSELKELISAQQQLSTTCPDYGASFLDVLKAFRSKEFLKPLLVGSIVALTITSIGGIFIIAFIIEIMLRLTGDRSKAFLFSIVSDILQIAVSLGTCYIIRIIKRRTLLFIISSIGCILLGLICIFSYLNTKEILHCKWLAPISLVVYMCIYKVWIALLIVIKTEIFPLQYRGLSNSITGIILSLLSIFCFKVTSDLIRLFDVHGMFGIYLALTVTVLVCLYFVLPETKDRTLQDIDNHFTELKLKITDSDHETANAHAPLKQ